MDDQSRWDADRLDDLRDSVKDLREALRDTRSDQVDLRKRLDSIEENTSALVVRKEGRNGETTVRPARVGIDLRTFVTIVATIAVPIAAILAPLLASR